MALSSIQPTTPATLLIVDDDSSAREGLRSLFETAGHKTITVNVAPAALRLLREEPCDLVMLDVELPDVDGLAFCRLVRAQPSLNQLPLVVFSANDSEGRKGEAFTAGADDYIVKPSTPGELISRVNSQLGIAQRESELRGTNRELSFLADLSRGLLRTLEPEQVARRVAGAMFEGTRAVMTACAIRNNGKGLAVCVFDREGSAGSSALIHQSRLEKWLSSTRSDRPSRIARRKDFLFREAGHQVEYLTPVGFGEKNSGALLVAFAAASDCTDAESRLIDAAAQQAAFAAQISRLYLKARESNA